MQHYWGAKAICDRIGYKSSNLLPALILRYRVPAYKRLGPKRKYCYYSNESMLSKWELTKAQDAFEHLKAKQVLKEEQKRQRQDARFRAA
jgi:hypothetical protein